MGGSIDARRNATAVNEITQIKSLEWFCKIVIMQVPPNYPGYGKSIPLIPPICRLYKFKFIPSYRFHLELLQSLLNSDYKNPTILLNFMMSV
ncbi:Poly-beta-hydroxyalkanoate depolymerase [Rickettsia canadensis str. CA410]|uniref:Poly-beta-hydroxyalkanoate depolymerase n=1 Tax=Rickettsia canadensis str. CA410 TaxID=1105107 RepID=A0ABM5MUS3_RICCA|nr:Poly-beta-hydroxyalkanoate depolymerase [Rickettsia canadensis str. CA410]